MTVTCACGRAFRAKPELSGKRVNCPVCGQIITVPAGQPAGIEPGPPDVTTDPLWDEVSQVQSGLPVANSGIQGTANPYGPPTTMAELGKRGAKRSQELTTEKIQRSLMLAFGTIVVLFGIGSLIKGIAMLGEGFAADKALGAGIGGIIVGGIILAFLAMGGKIRK